MLALKKNQKKLYAVIFIFLVLAGFLFFDTKFASAEFFAEALETSMNWVIRGILVAILALMSYLIQIAATLFEWIIVPDNMQAIMDNTAIYAIWTLVRDTLNIAFIMMLLFSAFCTVFQISKYNYKIILNLLLMALLVNFSFPIARVIIDFSNILMYYFLNQLGGPGAFASIADTGRLAGILDPKDPSIPFLFAAIIFSFIFAVTLLAIAVLLIIRSAVLAILVIFSPIAFVGSVVPGLSSHASKWWTYLFNNCFFGPVMIFMIYVATQMMNVLSQNSKFNSSLEAAASKQAASGLSGFITTASFFTIPIIILWIGIGMAKSMSAVGAEAVMGRAKKIMAGAGKKFSGYRGIEGRLSSLMSKRKAAREDKYNKFGQKWSDRFTLASTPAITEAQKERRDEARKRLQTEKDKKNRKFERDVNEYKDQVKHDTPANLHTELDALLNKTNKNGRDNVMLTAILEKLREDNDLDMSKLSFVSSGGDLVDEVEKAGGEKLGSVYANKLLKHAPDLSLTSARALAIANGESVAAGTGHIVTAAGAAGHFTKKIKGANGAKNLAPGSIEKINNSGVPGAQAAFLENIDHSVVGEFVRTNRLTDISDLSTTVNAYLTAGGAGGFSNSAKITWLKAHANPQISKLGKLIDADAKLKTLLGLN